jgi:predicted nucleotidyltransferase
MRTFIFTVPPFTLDPPLYQWGTGSSMGAQSEHQEPVAEPAERPRAIVLCGSFPSDRISAMSADGPEGTPVSQELVDKLRAYLAGRVDVSMAFIFGSRAKGTPTCESDIDVAIYFTPRGRLLEIEEDREDEELRNSRRTAEDEIWAAVEEIARVEADIVVLNRAPAAVAIAALGEGNRTARARPGALLAIQARRRRHRRGFPHLHR